MDDACRSALWAEAKATAVAQKATVAVLAIRASLLHFFRHDVDVDIILFVGNNNNLTGAQIHQTVLRLYYRRPFPFRVDSNNYLWRRRTIGAACFLWQGLLASK